MVLIDNFVTVQSALATAGSPVGSSALAAPEAIGGERDIHADLVSGSTALSVFVNPFGGEIFVHDSGAGVKGFSLIVWDGPDGDPTSINPVGLGGVDFTSSGQNHAIRLASVLADVSGVVSLTIFDADDASGDTWSRAMFSLPGGIYSPMDIDIPFADFTLSRCRAGMVPPASVTWAR
jgi:hypothetical protein